MLRRAAVAIGGLRQHVWVQPCRASDLVRQHNRSGPTARRTPRPLATGCCVGLWHAGRLSTPNDLHTLEGRAFREPSICEAKICSIAAIKRGVAAVRPEGANSNATSRPTARRANPAQPSMDGRRRCFAAMDGESSGAGLAGRAVGRPSEAGVLAHNTTIAMQGWQPILSRNAQVAKRFDVMRAIGP